MIGSVGGVLLAAGEGRRMGQPKALLDLDGTTAVCSALRVLAEGGCDPLVVVIGAHAVQVRDEVRSCAQLDRPPAVVENPGWADGMGSSLRAGLRAVAGTPGLVGALIHLVDQPMIGPAVIRRLIATAGDPDSGATRAWAATFGGRRRTPVLFSADVLAEIADVASGDRGARAWLDGNPDHVNLVACDDLGRPDDLDTPDDLAAYLAAHR